MKNSLIVALTGVFFCLTTGLHSQSLIAVEHQGTSSFYQNLDTAMYYAADGDIVYLPAASYNLSGTFRINHGVHIVGAGCNIDSSAATGITFFNGNLIIVSGADTGSIEGVYLNGNIVFGTGLGDQTVNMFSIKRCNFYDIFLSYNGGAVTASSNLLITENIIRNQIYGGYAQQVLVSKNIINSTVSFFNGNVLFENNVFLYPGCSNYQFAGNVSSITAKNNVFYSGYCNYYEAYQLTTTNAGNTFLNNLFPGNCGIQPGNISSGNIFTGGDSIFVYQTGNAWDPLHDYHLQLTCPGKNAGTDGTDIGLYGTASPKKEGEIPYNPHIQSKAIQSSTNAQGEIEVNIKVQAQDY